MLSWLRKKQLQPDYLSLDTRDKLATALRRGVLVRLLLIPKEFGGVSGDANVVFVPAWAADRKAGIDRDTIDPLTKSGKFRHYSARPAYKGDSLVPSSISVHVYDPGYFSAVIDIW